MKTLLQIGICAAGYLALVTASSAMNSKSFHMTSPAFLQNQPIPDEYTASGLGISPPIHWSGIPDGTKQLALVVEDQDAQSGSQLTPYTHWVIYGISPDTSGLPTDLPIGLGKITAPIAAVQGTNSHGTKGYTPPNPPQGEGTHHYRFRLFALDTPIHLKPGLSDRQVISRIQGHVIDETDLIGTYKRFG